MASMATLVPVTAHASQWLELVLFLPPTLLVLTATARSLRAQRRARHPAHAEREST